MFKSSSNADDSIDDSHYQIYRNVEFIIWKADQKKQKEQQSSFLSSLNESRDDSIDSSLYFNQNQISKVDFDDTSSAWNSQYNGGFLGQAPSTIDNQSEVESVFKMGTEKYLGSENHYMSEKFDISMSNANLDDETSPGNQITQGNKKKIKRVSRRKEGFVKLEYAGQGSMPVSNPTNKLNANKSAYTGAISYTGPRNNNMVSENDLSSMKSKRLHDYHNRKEGEGVPLKDEDEKECNNQSHDSQPLSFFAAMEKSEK